MKNSITQIDSFWVLDSRGTPTVCTRVTTQNGCGEAIVPSGASTGAHEACELRDHDSLFFGKGVEKAISNVQTKIAPLLIGIDVTDQKKIDSIMIEADNAQKSLLGANAILSVSLASARAGAACEKMALYHYLGAKSYHFPIPMLNLINGGMHADNGLEFQEFMIIPRNCTTFKQTMIAACQIYGEVKKLLKAEGKSCSVGDEGGFAPQLSGEKEALDLLCLAVQKSGYQADFALDIAASSLKEKASGEAWMKKIISLIDDYPIVSIEDPLDEEDWSGWSKLTSVIGSKCQIVGDDLFVTNPRFLERGIKEKSANAILIKPNQIGTLTETLEVIANAKKAGWKTIISHRSGDSEDSFIADLAVATKADFIKTGAPCRSERTCKYNRLLEIEFSQVNISKKIY